VREKKRRRRIKGRVESAVRGRGGEETDARAGRGRISDMVILATKPGGSEIKTPIFNLPLNSAANPARTGGIHYIIAEKAQGRGNKIRFGRRKAPFFLGL
jgi:hypothetical protein